MRNPFTGMPMTDVENGSLADYLENGGIEDELPAIMRKERVQLDSMKVGAHLRATFNWSPTRKPHTLYQMAVWVLRVDDSGTDVDFRCFYSSEGITEQRILRGWIQ